MSEPEFPMHLVIRVPPAAGQADAEQNPPADDGQEQGDGRMD